MNQLLRRDKLGYIVWSEGLDGGGARLVRLTKVGPVAHAKIHDILATSSASGSPSFRPERFVGTRGVAVGSVEEPAAR
jgi:hypothetical protein